MERRTEGETVGESDGYEEGNKLVGVIQKNRYYDRDWI